MKPITKAVQVPKAAVTALEVPLTNEADRELDATCTLLPIARVIPAAKVEHTETTDFSVKRETVAAPAVEVPNMLLNTPLWTVPDKLDMVAPKEATNKCDCEEPESIADQVALAAATRREVSLFTTAANTV